MLYEMLICIPIPILTDAKIIRQKVNRDVDMSIKIITKHGVIKYDMH